MKKIFAIFLAFVLISCSIVFVLAAPSPTTSADIGGITVETTDSETIDIPKEAVPSYFDIIHVYNAEKDSDLDKIGEQLKKDDKFDDKSLVDLLGDEFANSKLIQLFTVEKGSDYIDGSKITVGDYVIGEDGTHEITNVRIVSVKNSTVSIRIDCPSVNENMDIRLIQFIKGQWAQAEHVRVYNGYLTFDFNIEEDFGSVWAVTTEKAPVSPPTGDSLNAVYFALFTIAVLGIAFVTRKYLAHK